MKMLRVFGCTLIVAAILMHFSFCRWDEPNIYGKTAVFVFVYPRRVFEEHLASVAVWGLVFPTLMAGGGLGLLCHGKSESEPKSEPKE